MNSILIYADGSSIGNPGPGGWGVIIRNGSEVKEFGGREKTTTNNRMELRAAIEALRSIEVEGEIEVRTDSKYVIKGITEWVESWKANGWKTTNKSPVENKDLWEELLLEVEGKSINWRYVEAHAGVPGNERVDEIAQGFARGGNLDLYSGSKEGYGVDLDIFEAEEPFYISFANGVFGRHKLWKECEVVVRGVAGAKFKKVTSESQAKKLEESWRLDAER